MSETTAHVAVLRQMLLACRDPECTRAMQARIAALSGDGFVLVPREPTPAMSAAGLCVSEAEHDPAGVYRAMLAAAPDPQTAQGVA